MAQIKRNHTMKKVVLLASFIVGISMNSFAQKGSVAAAEYELTAEKPNLEKAKEKIDEAVVNEKSFDYPRTYIVKCKVYSALYKESKKKDEANPKSALLDEALAAIQKAEELDEKGNEKGKGIGKYKDEIGKELTMLRIEVLNDGVGAYNKKDYKAATNGFMNVLAVDSMDSYIALQENETATVDTAVMFNAAISAYYAEEHDLAVDLLKKVAELGYSEDTPYLMLYTEYRDQKDTVNMVETLKVGFIKYPENNVFINDLVIYYINTGKMEEGMEYINKALEMDPTNTGFWFAKGTFLDKQGEKDEAIKCYDRVLESATTDEDIYNANYNIGVIYYNQAVDKYEKANAIEEYSKYKAAVAEANEAMKVALPYFEKCYSIKPKDRSSLTNLSSVYYRLSKDSKDMQKKYEKIEAELKALPKTEGQ